MKNNHNSEVLFSFQRIISTSIQKINFSKLVRKIKECKYSYLHYTKSKELNSSITCLRHKANL